LALVLRKIRKSKWYRHDGVKWLTADGLQADALTDLRTEGNALSVFLIQDDKSDLNRVVAAIAASADHLSSFDYALFDESVIRDANLKVVNRPGATPDPIVNSSHHRDLIELTTESVLILVNAIRDAPRERKLPGEIRKLLANAISEGNLSIEKLTPHLRESL
jgi:hypothetical protein